VVLVSDVTSPTSIGLPVAVELAPLVPVALLAPLLAPAVLAAAVLAAAAVLDDELPELLQAATARAAAAIAARDATLARLADHPPLRDSTLSLPLMGQSAPTRVRRRISIEVRLANIWSFDVVSM
jgi:hypothetical protein